MKDLFGKAMFDHFTGNSPASLFTETNISEADEFPLDYLFRTYDEMPEIEKTAMNLAYGEILDVGCGAGSHALFLQDNGLTVTATDISPKAIETCILRGIANAECASLFDLGGKFNTITVLMNGTGICGTLSRLPAFLQKLKSLLAPGGQVLIDSSDIIYMFDVDPKGAPIIPAGKYYGELEFRISYKKDTEKFDWLYTDFGTLKDAAAQQSLNCELILEGQHFDYLARLSV